jgi:hypothetical protein
LPFAALRTASIALRNPADRNRAVPLSYDQFRYSFANEVAPPQPAFKPPRNQQNSADAGPVTGR